MQSLNLNSVVNTVSKPLIAGVAAGGISLFLNGSGNTDLLGFNVSMPLAIGAVVAAGSFAAQATKEFVIPLLTKYEMTKGLVEFAMPLWTGALAVAADYALYGNQASPMNTFIAGAVGQFVASWFENASQDLQGTSKFAG